MPMIIPMMPTAGVAAEVKADVKKPELSKQQQKAADEAEEEYDPVTSFVEARKRGETTIVANASGYAHPWPSLYRAPFPPACTRMQSSKMHLCVCVHHALLRPCGASCSIVRQYTPSKDQLLRG